MLTNYWTRNSLVSTTFKQSQCFDRTVTSQDSGGQNGPTWDKG